MSTLTRMNTMKYITLTLLSVMIVGCAKQSPYPTVGSVERLDPRLDRLIPRNAQIEQIATGFEWSEGPLYVKKGGYLLFSDVPRNVIYKWNDVPGNTECEVFMEPSGYTGREPRSGEMGSNGLTFDNEGRLTICQHGDRRVALVSDEEGKWTTLAAQYEGRRLNSPNDAVWDRDGNLYFTDPFYGLEGGISDPAREIPWQGVYRRDRNGKVTMIIKNMTRPNGIALSPDHRTLYVNNSDPNKAVCMAYDIKWDGTLINPRVFFDVTPLVKQGHKGLPDGLKVDRKGNVFATGPGGVLVFDKDGTHLGTIHTGALTANCAFGGRNGSTLYMTADSYVCRIKTKTRGQD